MDNKGTNIKKKSLTKQFAVLFGIIAIAAVLISGAVTYVNQTNSYHKDCINSLKQMTAYLNGRVGEDEEEFVFLKTFFTEHPDQVRIPVDFRADYASSKAAFYAYVQEHYQGRVPGAGLSYDEMDEEAQRLYFTYRFEYWFAEFFDAAEDFGLSYIYFIFPKEGEDHTMIYMFDPAMETTTDENGNEILLLGYEAYEDPALHKYMWEAWDKGEGQDYIDSLDNEFGYVYTYSRPLVVNGEKLGLFCVDASVDRINSDIRNSVLRQVGVEAVIFAIATLLLYLFLKSKLLDRIARLMKGVQKYSNEKEPEIANEISAEKGQNDELGALSDSFAGMITDLDIYMKDLQTVTAEKERIGAELNVATKIQADMLPTIFPAFPDIKEFDIYATMDPAKEVGGDFYDFFMVDEKHLAVVIADVSGKGVPAALFMVIAKTLIKNHMLMGESPAEALMNVNNQLCENNDAGLFVTVWLALVDIETGHVVEANAGHENPALSGSDGPYTMRKTRHSPAVAAMEGMIFREHEFDIKPGDRIFVYTDGVTEATNSSMEMFGEDRLEITLNKYCGARCKELLPAIRSEIDEFVGDAPQFDDITMLCLEYHGKDGK